MKIYKVQTWDKHGALTNHYEVVLSNAKELKELRTFLSAHHGKVLIVELPKKR